VRSPRAEHRASLGLPRGEKPQLLHVMVGAVATVFSCYVLSQFFRAFLADATIQLLSLGQIPIGKSLSQDGPLLLVRSMNGSNLSIVLTWQRCGIFSIIIFGLLFTFLVFPLKGSVWLKLFWLGFGNAVGLTWVVVRLSAGVIVAYHFGIGAFTSLDFVIGPIIDLLWVISVWSLGLSLISRGKASSEREAN